MEFIPSPFGPRGHGRVVILSLSIHATFFHSFHRPRYLGSHSLSKIQCQVESDSSRNILQFSQSDFSQCFPLKERGKCIAFDSQSLSAVSLLVLLTPPRWLSLTSPTFPSSAEKKTLFMYTVYLHLCPTAFILFGSIVPAFIRLRSSVAASDNSR